VIWWQALLFYLLGGAGGATLCYLVMWDKVEQRATEVAKRTYKRKLAENGRKGPARIDAGPPAKVHRPRTRKRNLKP